MVSSGGGPNLPAMNSPLEMLIVLAICVIVIWLVLRAFSG
jgi:hypothetical protein